MNTDSKQLSLALTAPFPAEAIQLVNGGSVVCTLSVKVDGEWVDKTDVGSPSE
jgi:hypothetical protein